MSTTKPLVETAAREVREETGIDASHYGLQDWGIENRFEIFKQYRSRYADGVTHNQEHVFGLELPAILPVRLQPREHLRYEWLPWKEAAERTLSWTNRDAILLLPQRRRRRSCRMAWSPFIMRRKNAMNKPLDLKLEAERRERAEYVLSRTDKYFTKSRQIVEKFGDKTVTYGVFLRRGTVCAVNPALEILREYYPQDAVPLKITRLYEEGAFVPDQKPIFTYTGSFAALVELETRILRPCATTACVSAYNAHKMATGLPKVAFIDMHARHACGDDLSILAAYGAAVGSRIAKLSGALGFLGSSQDLTAHFYGQENGLGTMPHAIIGYAGSTLRAAQMYAETHPQDNLTVLVDYYAREFSDALEVCRWWYNDIPPGERGSERSLAFRIDTHGERYAEGLDYEQSVDLVATWLHVLNEYEAVRTVMGDEAYDSDTLNIVKDRVRKVLFGTGVSVASVIRMRQTLDAAGFNSARIVGSSGFTPFKCKMFGHARAPVDVIGTGSFIPEAFGERSPPPTYSCTTANSSSRSGARSCFRD